MVQAWLDGMGFGEVRDNFSFNGMRWYRRRGEELGGVVGGGLFQLSLTPPWLRAALLLLKHLTFMML